MTVHYPPGLAEASDHQLSRRTVLAGIGGLGGLGLLGPGRVTGQPTAAYSVVQGDRCIPVTPLTGEEPVEALYGLRIPPRFGGENGALRTTDGPYYESTGTVDLQRRDTTITFLYDGPEGLSMVVVHDHVDDGGPAGTGSAVTWTLTGLPSTGDWAVKDSLLVNLDTGEMATVEADRWDVNGATHRIDWTWGKGSTDGGAFRGLSEGFSVTIDPAYNEAATLWGTKNEGRITDWQFLSGDRAAPTRESLALDEPVTVRAGGCGGAVTVRIDVRPGSNDNPVNPRANGVIPVAIHGAASVDPSDIDVASLRFGAPDVVDAGGGANPAHDGHGAGPLLVHFPVVPGGFEAGDTQAKLVGRTHDGRWIVGTDGIRTVGDEGSESRRDREHEKAERKREKEAEKAERQREKVERKREKEAEKAERQREDGDDDDD